MLIFDMDGTLIDSNGIWRDVDIAFLEKRGLPYTKEYYEGVAHTIFPLAAVFTKEYCKLEESCEEIMAEWMAMAGDMYATAVTVKPGVVDYLEQCRAKGERMMVLTSSVPQHCRTALTHLGLMEYFERVVFAQELGLEKKNPECFRRAADGVPCPGSRLLLPLVSEQRAGFSLVSCGEQLCHGIFQFIQPRSGHGGELHHSSGGMIFHRKRHGEIQKCIRRGQILLRPDQNPSGTAGGGQQEGHVLLCDGMGAIHHSQHQIGRLHSSAAAFHTDALHGVLRFPDARRVDQAQQRTAADHGLLYRVAGGAGNIGDDGAVVARQCIEQGAFSRVGTTHDGGADTGFQHLATAAGCKQAAQLLICRLQSLLDLLRLNILDILIRVIHHSIKAGGNLQQRILNGL